MAKLEDYTISFRLDGSEIDYMIISKTIDEAFKACDMLLATDPFISDARVVRSQEDIVIEVEHDKKGLGYLPVKPGRTAKGIFIHATDALHDGNR